MAQRAHAIPADTDQRSAGARWLRRRGRRPARAGRNQARILGLHNCEHSTILHVHATGSACHTAYGPDEPYSWPPLWILDSGNRWHVTRTSGRSGQNGEMALRLEIVPPLSSKTAWIEVVAAGQSAQARARLPLRWQEL